MLIFKVPFTAAKGLGAVTEQREHLFKMSGAERCPEQLSTAFCLFSNRKSSDRKTLFS